MLGNGVALAAGMSLYEIVLTPAHALYSLSQDNWPFTRNVISQPAALNELVAIVDQDHTSMIKGKGKSKANGSANDDGRALLTRVLVAGESQLTVCADIRRDETLGPTWIQGR